MRRLVWSMLAVAVVMAAPPGAGAQVVDDNPSAASRGAGQVSVFLRGQAGDLQYSELSGGGFTPWASLGGIISSGPGSAGRSASITDVLARGTDNGMYHQAFVVGTGWSGFNALGGALLSAPGVDVRQGGGYIDTYYRGTDNAIVARSWTPAGGWGAPDTTSLGGGTLAAPALVSRAPEVLDIFIRGTDDSLYRDAWSGSAWSGWTVMPGGMKTGFSPAATTRTTGTMDLFARGTDGEVRWASFDGAVWSSWRSIAGAVESGPAAVADTSNRIWLFARQGGDVAYNVYSDGSWSGWQPMHPPPPPPAPPACAAGAGRLTAHARGVDYGKRPLISGRARRADGAPLMGATVTVKSGTWTRTAAVAPSGHYRIRIPAGPTRRLQLTALAPSAGSLACVTMRARTRAGVRLAATKRVRPRGVVRFRGTVRGKGIPRSGKLVELQAFDGGRWRVFAQPRTNRKGAFKTSYRLRRTFRPRNFRFRARVRKESGFPYEVGYSRSVRVRVRR